MRVRKTCTGRVLMLNKRERNTLERAREILIEMGDRLEQRFAELGVEDCGICNEVAKWDLDLGSARFHLNCAHDSVDWPEKSPGDQ